MKKTFFSICLLFVFLSLFVSCNKVENYYRTGKYEQAVEAADSLTKPRKYDYLYKAKALVELGRKEEAKESILLYLMMVEETDDRSFATDLFVDLNFSDVLNILILRPEDGVKQRIALYKSYAALGETDQAISILNLLTQDLTFADFATLIVNFPCSSDYNATIFQAWQQNLNDTDIALFTELIVRFARQENVTENASQILIKTAELAMADERFKYNNVLLSRLYKASAYALENIHDTYNSSIYLEEAKRLNPADPELNNDSL